ncbi:MAG: aspartate aminotransferase [Pseudohongiellaceae bacterium]|jgi:aspartate aminotransferase
MKPSKRSLSIPASVTFSIDSRVKELMAEGVDVIGLGAGQPDFPCPPEAVAAATAFIAGGHVGYTPAAGIPPLRSAAAKHLSRVTGVSYDGSQVVVTDGAKEALILAIAAVADPGDEILVPTPGWLSYQPMALINSVIPIDVPTDAAQHFKLTPAALDAAITERTRAVVINSPGNPTGGVYSEDELRALCAVIVARDIALISDEIYWCFVFEGKHISPASMPGMAERTIVVNGVSKSHAMTGWRIGFLAAPGPLAKICASMKSHMTSNAAAPSQHAALAALEAGNSHTEMMAKAFLRRRNLAVAALQALPGVELTPPDGAFYVFPRVDAHYSSDVPGSVEFCAALLEQERLAAVPGAAFGEDRCIRISTAADDKVILDGIARLGQFLQQLSA